MKRYSLIIIATLAAALLFSTACAPHAEVALPSTPEPTVSITTAPTATLTPTASPAPTPTPIFSDARMAELNQQFQDFLNKEGEFTQEKIASMMMQFYTGTEIDYYEHFKTDTVGLGISDWEPLIQGYLFDYFEKDGRILLLFGFDGRDGNRFITPVEIALYFLDSSEKAGLWVTKSLVNTIDCRVYGTQSDTAEYAFETTDCSDRNVLFPLLDSLKGKVFAFYLPQSKFPDSDVDSLNLDTEAYNCYIEYTDEHDSKIELSIELIELVTSNDLDYERSTESKVGGDTLSIIRIDNVNNIDEIDISRIPETRELQYFEDTLIENVQITPNSSY